MKIKVYLATVNMTMKEFSKKLGYNSSYLARVSWGHILPGEQLAKQIYELTDGLVVLKTKQKKTREERLLEELAALRKARGA